MNHYQCLIFLESETLVSAVAAGIRNTRSRRSRRSGERSAPLKYVLLPSGLEKDHPVCIAFHQAGFQAVDNQTNVPENVRFDFRVMVVGDNFLSEMEEKWGYENTHSDGFGSSVKWLLDNYQYGYWTRHEVLSAIEGNLLLVEKFLEHGPDIRDIDRNCTLLHFAVEMRSMNLLKLLLDRGANINARGMARNKIDSTALHLTAEDGILDMVKLLVEKGADLSLRDSGGSTPLHVAVRHGRLGIVKYLLDCGANLNVRSNMYQQDRGATPLHTAVFWGHEGIVALLLERGANVNAECYNGRSVLYLAVNPFPSGNSVKVLNIFETVVRYAPDVDQLSNKKAFECALCHNYEGYREMALSLLKYGFDVSVEASGNSGLLLGAISNNLHPVVEKLLNSGADVNLLDKSWNTKPLHHAANCADGDMIQLLLKHGAGINDVLEDQFDKRAPKITPLSEAIHASNSSTATTLLANNADFRRRPELLRTAVRRCPEVVQLMIDRGANFKELDSKGRTLLHEATAGTNFEVVQLLLEKGLDVDACDRNGQTPISVAAFEGSPEVIDVLVKFGAHSHCAPVYRTTVKSASFQAFLDYGFADSDLTSETHLKKLLKNSYKESAGQVARHFVKLEVAFGSARPIIPAALRKQLTLNKFKADCQREVAAMKRDMVVNTTVSVYDILTERTEQISGYARNEHFPQTLDALNVKENYPIYASVLERQLRKGVWRRQILNAGVKLLRSLDPRKKFTGLPYEIKEKIVNYLSNQDILILKSKMPNASANLLAP